MTLKPTTLNIVRIIASLALVLLTISLDARSESCQTSTEIDAAAKAALNNAAQQYYGYVAAANTQALATNSIPDIASKPDALTGLLQQNAKDLAGSTATVRNVYILDATGGAPVLDRAQFFCGVFNPNSENRTGFTLESLPAGKYGLVIMDVQNSKAPFFYSFLLKQEGAAWKIAGLFPRPRQIAGHDAKWYWEQARTYKSKGQTHNAWFFYLAARELAAPLPFMGTTQLDNFYEEIQQSTPPDLPEKNPITVSAGNGKTYSITNLFVIPDDRGGLDLVMKYKNPDIADTGKTFVENKEVMKALLTKYPEFREPFGSLVARAVAPSGQDFGSMLPMKDIR